jgi:hypothetical protein
MHANTMLRTFEMESILDDKFCNWYCLHHPDHPDGKEMIHDSRCDIIMVILSKSITPIFVFPCWNRASDFSKQSRARSIGLLEISLPLDEKMEQTTTSSSNS